jgi:intraflagellar transport protein 74
MGRQIQDSRAYMAQLRSKITELTTEIEKFKGEIQRFNKDTTEYSQLERRYEAVIKEVRGLEGQLADYNLAMDKSRTSTDPAEIRSYQMQLRERNAMEEKEGGKVLIDRQNRERMTLDLEAQIGDIHRRAEEKINQLEPRKLAEYQNLLGISEQLNAEIQNAQMEIAMTSDKIQRMEGEMREDRW